MENDTTPQGLLMSRETKIMLLRWLKQGYIDKGEFIGLSNEIDKSMTMEEIKEELTRLELMRCDDICNQFISHNVCKWCYSDGTPKAKKM